MSALELLRKAKIGDVVVFDGKKVDVKLATYNSECMRCVVHAPHPVSGRCMNDVCCMSRYREDRMSVIFVEHYDSPESYVYRTNVMDDFKRVARCGGFNVDEILCDGKSHKASSQRRAVANVLDKLFGYKAQDICSVTGRAQSTTTIMLGVVSPEYDELLKKVLEDYKNGSQVAGKED